MTEPSSGKGNNPELWNKLLADLDEKLQFGLLERLRRVQSYHFEGDTLFIQPANQDDHLYLSKPAFLQQLQVFASHSSKVETIKVKALE